ncbi:hypothetical protein Tsubulata_003980 [Turnera subulata]|uniref:RING-type E3 ubiquitin transferase n=1 Tax=Turnera subulata TaxID=218843 RepID=A0A9Q0JLV1_9ROSI|nr:hypothetical protein Tsubulata_003980 [Turnera subulata]
MAKFSVRGDDDGEGSSRSRRCLNLIRYQRRRQDPNHSSSSSPSSDEENENSLYPRVTRRRRRLLELQEPDIGTAPSPWDVPPQEVVAQVWGRRAAATSTETELQPPPSPQPQPQQPVLEEDSEGGSSSSYDALGSVILTETDVLDCPVCCEPLTAPVFQCENGHTACSSCCRKLASKCPSCSMSIGYNRCRAIEKVLEAAKIACPNLMYGCKERVTYSKKYDHEKTCIYAPCSCPHPGCNFVSSFRQLYLHSSSEHSGSVIQFQFNQFFPLYFTTYCNFLVLQEVCDGVLFILNNKVERYGNVITLSCIRPSSLEGGYSYDLTAKLGETTLNFQSVATSTQAISQTPPSVDFIVPSKFFGSNGGTTLRLCIWEYVHDT